MERHAVARAARRAAAILLVAVAVTSPCAILEKSELSVPLAISMNISEPLIALNAFVQGSATRQKPNARVVADEGRKRPSRRSG